MSDPTRLARHPTHATEAEGPTHTAVEVSVLLVVDRAAPDLEALVAACCEELRGAGRAFEVVCVLDGDRPEARAALERLHGRGLPIRLLAFATTFGAAAALSVAARHARGRLLLTLPVQARVAPGELGRLLDALNGSDMVIGRRDPAGLPALARFKTRVLNALLRLLLGSPFRDLGTGVRALRREVLDELVLYGEQNLFLPVLAWQQGFRVEERDVVQGLDAPPAGGIRPGRLLDVVAIYFLLRFTRRPFRFFGGIGLVILLAGLAATAWLVAERLFLGVSLGDRPALVLSTLLVVLGFQVIAVGLIGEIVTFTHAKDLKDYKVARILE